MTKTLKQLRIFQRSNKETLNVHKVNSVFTLSSDWFFSLTVSYSLLEVFQHCDFPVMGHGWEISATI
jgi:hypothetical protein